MSVQVSIFHYAPDWAVWMNDIVLLQVKSIRELTTDVPYKLNVIDNEIEPNARKDLASKLPPNVELISVPKHEVLCGPAGINGAILNNKSDYLVILHTDVLVTWNWLSTWLTHVKNAEAKYGVPCAVSCQGLLPYPSSPLNEETKRVQFGGRADYDYVRDYLEKTMHIEWKAWNNLPIGVSKPTILYDVGNELGLYMANKKFWEEVGLHDETMTATLDGIDMGLRTLKTRCRNLIGGGLWLHHISGLHTNVGCRLQRQKDGNWVGTAEFIKKWGPEVSKKMGLTTLWTEFHNEQQQKYGK